ncbi:hypothetical protein HY625_03010 [Candidatus Uhrbacteria bacterium]|nr:hypothetical protein [Candidatus Uhrbacteria bacterium]
MHYKVKLMHAVGSRERIKKETIAIIQKGMAVMISLIKMLHRFARRFLGYPSGLPQAAAFAN